MFLSSSSSSVSLSIAQATGTPIGTVGSWANDGNTIAKVFDGNLTTFFDGPAGDGCWVGLDFGSIKQIYSLSYAPRIGWSQRMVGGVFQGSNVADFSTNTILYTITAAPPASVLTTILVSGSFRYVRYVSPLRGYCNIAEMQFFVILPPPIPITPKMASGETTMLDPAVSYVGPVGFEGLSKATLNGSGATLMAPATTSSGTGLAFTTWTTTSGMTITDTEFSSVDGNGQVSRVRGTDILINNVYVGGKNGLLEGFDHDEVVNLTISGGGQSGQVAGRCHFFNNVKNLTWTGGTFGPASTQSPVRFSYPGVVGGVIEAVTITQVNSPNPIACWAIHSASGVKFIKCVSLGAEFSLDSAGDGGVVDAVVNCMFDQLYVYGVGQHQPARLAIHAVANNCVFTSPKIVNDLGWGVTLDGCTACTIDKAEIWSNAGFQFITAADVKITNSTLYTTNKNAIIFAGDFNQAKNDLGGNKVVVVSAEEWAAKSVNVS